MAILNRIYGFIGPKRSGKTHKAIEFLQPAQFPRTVIFDPVDNPEWKIPAIRGNPRALAQAMKAGIDTSGGFFLRYVPLVVVQKTQYSISPALNWLCALCYRLGDVLIAIDEAHLFCSPWAIPPDLSNAIRLGGNRKLSFLYISHGFSDVHTILTKNTDEFFFWKNINPSDMDGIAKRCGKDASDRVQALPKLEVTAQGVTPGGVLHWTIERGIEA